MKFFTRRIALQVAIEMAGRKEVNGIKYEIPGLTVKFAPVEDSQFCVFYTSTIQDDDLREKAENRLSNVNGFGSTRYDGDPYGKDKEKFENGERYIADGKIYKGDPVANTMSAELRAVKRAVKSLKEEKGRTREEDRELVSAEKRLKELEIMVPKGKHVQGARSTTSVKEG